MTDLEKLLSFTIEDKNGCMIWQKGFTTCGYPRVYYKGNGNVRVNRLVLELSTGKKLGDKVARHTCDNPKCINPEHLVEGTLDDNVKDRVERGRSWGHVSEEEVKLVYSLRVQGYFMKDIAKALGIKFKRVEYILNKFENPLGSGG